MSENFKKLIAEKRPLSEDDEVDLLGCGDEKLIWDYMWGHCLSRKAQIALFKAKNTRLIRFFIGQDPLCDEAEQMLVEMADPVLLDDYVSRHGIGKAAKLAILASGNEQLIQVYRNRKYCFKTKRILL